MDDPLLRAEWQQQVLLTLLPRHVEPRLQRVDPALRHDAVLHRDKPPRQQADVGAHFKERGPPLRLEEPHMKRLLPVKKLVAYEQLVRVGLTARLHDMFPRDVPLFSCARALRACRT